MGALKFRIQGPETVGRTAELRKANVTGLDRTPARVGVELRPGLLICHRDTSESGRLSVPWPVEGFGQPIVSTATLAERAEPYDLAVELARGRLNEVRNQMADWSQMGLRTPADLVELMGQAQREFVAAATSRDDPARTSEATRACLSTTWKAGHKLVQAYTAQVLQNRLSVGRLPTLFGLGLAADPATVPGLATVAGAFNSAQLDCNWRSLAPAEGTLAFEGFDARLAWCNRQKLTAQAGPLLEFRPGAIPDWLWLWEGDYDSILSFAVDLVRQVITRYRGQVPIWQLVHRPASSQLLGLSEEEQIRLTAKMIQVARQIDPAAQYLIGLDRPWSEWMGSSPFQLGPLHLSDYLVRADLGLGGLGLEIALGYTPPGSHLRNLFDFSKLLDLYSQLSVPLYISLLVPSSGGLDPLADPSIAVAGDQWPATPDETSQAHWAAEWIALAAAKPFVRSVVCAQVSDAVPHVFPHAGLLRPDHSPKPILPWVRSFHDEVLAR